MLFGDLLVDYNPNAPNSPKYVDLTLTRKISSKIGFKRNKADF